MQVAWTGNRGRGTSGYRDYARDHTVSSTGVPDIAGSSDRSFHGDATRWNPEQLLLAALSQCHLLSYLHAAAMNGVIVEQYRDAAIGTMEQRGQGGRFTSVTLRPEVVISAGDPELALRLHRTAAENCFIAASVNFPVGHEPRILAVDELPVPASDG